MKKWKNNLKMKKIIEKMCEEIETNLLSNLNEMVWEIG